MKKNKFLWTLALSSSCLFALASCGSQGQKGEQGDPGINGTNGTDGKDGENGQDGKSVLTGKGSPASTLGNDGDSYIDTLTFDFYTKEEGTWSKIGNIKGTTGETGSKGEKGTSVRTGKGEPSDTLGNNGDSYIDLSTFDFYIKEDGTWSKEGNIKGDKGDQGDKGDKGDKGTSGSTGSKGDDGATAWSNTFLPSNYGYITPSAGSVVADDTNEISFTVHHLDYDNYRCSELVLKNPKLDDGELVISASDAEKNGSDYTFTTTMKEGGFVVSANYASKNLSISLPDNSILTGGSISIEGDSGNTNKYFSGQEVTLKITLDSEKYRIKSGTFKLNGIDVDESKIEGSGTSFTYKATIGENGLKVDIEFEKNEDLAYTYNEELGGYVVTGKGGFESGALEIPSKYKGKDVVAIGNNAFNGQQGSGNVDNTITSVTIPSSVTSIGQCAFYNCTSITSITIEKDSTSDKNVSIEYSAFYGLTSLETVTIPDSVTNIGSSAFRQCTKLATITIPNSVTSIGDYAFQGCSALIKIEIPDSVTSLGEYTFMECTNLTSAIIGDGVKEIKQYTFRKCSKLKTIVIGNSVTQVFSLAFNVNSESGSKSTDLKLFYHDKKLENGYPFINSDTSSFALDDLYYYYENESDIPNYSSKNWHYADDGVTPVIWGAQ